jgi:hypothetical protein
VADGGAVSAKRLLKIALSLHILFIFYALDVDRTSGSFVGQFRPTDPARRVVLDVALQAIASAKVDQTRINAKSAQSNF